MNQEVKYINIRELVLWTENPRDPIEGNAVDQDIVDRALNDISQKWTLAKLAKEMGPYYDFSELPTVVYHGKKPVVYDGNRRIILGKIKHGLVVAHDSDKTKIPEFPEKIPCNVCKKEIALKNVYRKHSDTGSWLPLERDIFLNKFMRKEKSLFLTLEEETGVISANPHLNQRFVKDEIFKEEILKEMGFTFDNGKLHSVHSSEEAYSIFFDISKKIEDKVITTRKNRGMVIEVLEPDSQKIIDQNRKNEFHPTIFSFTDKHKLNIKKQSRRTVKKNTEIFGGRLYLCYGVVSDLYRDISDLYQIYIKQKTIFSKTFPNIIRMSLRLLCEIAAKDKDNKGIDDYIKDYFSKAKKSLDNDTLTTLSNYNVTENSLRQLLHTGAHCYRSSSNIEQTIAISIIIGEMITLTHGKG